jgi:hypothetical protein
MPRRLRFRRFDPFYPISDATVAVEAEQVCREFEKLLTLGPIRD